MTTVFPILGLVFIGAACVLFRIEGRIDSSAPAVRPVPLALALWPRLWLLVRVRRLDTVKSALGLRNPKPCPCREGFAGVDRLFVAQAGKGWVVVVGPALPEPSEDIDACFRFVRDLSSKLGQVQLFCTDPTLGQHAWVRAKRGRILRAYAWAGKTLWNQGPTTPEEKALGLHCFDYAAGEAGPRDQATLAQLNCERVAQLAACWGVAWSDLEQLVTENRCGIAGDPSKGL